MHFKLIIGLVEALGAGCYPDPSKGAAYKTAFGLVYIPLSLACLVLRLSYPPSPLMHRMLLPVVKPYPSG